MKTRVLFLISALLIFASQGIFAQDKIFKRNQEIIECRVTEIGSEFVKYVTPEYGDDLTFSLETEQILKVVFANGVEKYFTREMDNPDNYRDNKKNAIKVDFLSPLSGNTTFAYERSLKPGASVEATLGIIGLGFDPGEMNAGGAFVKFGYKFIKSPDIYFSKMRYSHILKGAYFKPEISFGYYSRDSDEFYDPYQPTYTERYSVFSGAVHLVFGKQWIVNNVFLVDWYFGVGYGFDDTGGEGGYHFGYATAPSEFPISATTGLKIGILFD